VAHYCKEAGHVGFRVILVNAIDSVCRLETHVIYQPPLVIIKMFLQEIALRWHLRECVGLHARLDVLPVVPEVEVAVSGHPPLHLLHLLHHQGVGLPLHPHQLTLVLQGVVFLGLAIVGLSGA